MKTYKEKEIYTFKVVELYQNPNTEKWWIKLEGVDGKTTRVAAYDYQIEWKELPASMKCFVEGIDKSSGCLYLRQYWPDVLNAKYSKGERYDFKVKSVNLDPVTNNKYYQIVDILSGLEHRFYDKSASADYAAGDMVRLRVVDIVTGNGNSAYLEFKDKRPRIDTTKSMEKESPVSRTTEIQNDDDFAPGTDEQREESELLKAGKFGRETNTREFKSSIVFPAGGTDPDIDKQLTVIMKVIASFQNSDGGCLFIGVNDRGDVCGINNDFAYLNSSQEDEFRYQLNVDGYENKIRCVAKKRLGTRSNNSLHFRFFQNSEQQVYCVIDINRESRPVYLDGNKLFERAGNMIQTLKGEDITNFVAGRLKGQILTTVPISVGATPIEKITEVKSSKPEEIASSPVTETVQPEDAVEIVEEKKLEEVKTAPIPNLTIKKKSGAILVYINLFKNGEWSYTKKSPMSKGVLKVIPVLKSQKSKDLLQCYSCGTINRVKISDVLSKNESKRYKNGIFKDSDLIDAMVCDKHDLVAIKSQTKDKTQWMKVHHISAITCHKDGKLDLKGNQIVKNGAKLLKVGLIPVNYAHFVSELILKDSQTSQYQGFEIKEGSILKNSMAVVNKLCEW